ncbi:MAG: 2-nitropropane dioxygenase, partial [Nocardioides sp.]
MTTAAGAPVQPPVLPVPVRVHLAHAVIERIALDAGVDLLHVKGPATDPRLDPQTRSSSDVDVLVRPAHLADFQQALAAAGWRKFSSIERGSAFSHAANWWHDHWGYVDVHAHWPGARIDAEAAYDVFAEGGYLLPIAHQPCRVPGLVAQGLLRVMHEGRSRAGDPGRLAFLEHGSWLADVESLAQRVDAELALAAGLGQLDRFREDPAYDLWRFFGQGGSRWAEGRGRWRAARGVRA